MYIMNKMQPLERNFLGFFPDSRNLCVMIMNALNNSLIIFLSLKIISFTFGVSILEGTRYGPHVCLDTFGPVFYISQLLLKLRYHINNKATTQRQIYILSDIYYATLSKDQITNVNGRHYPRSWPMKHVQIIIHIL